MRLNHKICAITGGGGGIGRAAAELFAAEGATVFILERNPAAGMDAEQQIRAAGNRAAFVPCDVSDHDAVKTAFDRIRAEAGALHVLYNNASVYWNGRDGKLADIEPEIWNRVIGINLNGVYHCCRQAVALMMRSGGGSIINTASSAGLIGIPNCDAYTAAKGATIALTRSLAVEYGPCGIRTNCIAPAAIMTPMVRESNPADGSDEFDEEAFLKLRTPLRRYGTPEEVARIALFLASDEASYVNGAILPADGGITICGDLARVRRDSAAR